MDYPGPHLTRCLKSLLLVLSWDIPPDTQAGLPLRSCLEYINSTSDLTGAQPSFEFK